MKHEFFLSIGCCCFFWVLNRNNIQDLFVGTDFDKRILHSRFSGNFSGCSVPSRPTKLPSNLECRILSIKSTLIGLRPIVVDFKVNRRLRRNPSFYFYKNSQLNSRALPISSFLNYHTKQGSRYNFDFQ